MATTSSPVKGQDYESKTGRKWKWIACGEYWQFRKCHIYGPYECGKFNCADGAGWLDSMFATFEDAEKAMLDE